MPDNKLTPAKDSKSLAVVQHLSKMLDDNRDKLAKALDGAMSPDFFVRLVLAAVTSTPKLADCHAATLIRTAVECATLGLQPNTQLGEAYLIPYFNRAKGQYECRLQIGGNGYVALAYRTGLVKMLDAVPVFEGERFEWRPLNFDAPVTHEPRLDIKDGAPVVGAYAYAQLTTGVTIWTVLREFEIASIRANAVRGSSSVWDTHPHRMARRSALNRLILKHLPLNDKMRSAEPANEMTGFDGPIVDLAPAPEPKLRIKHLTPEPIGAAEASETAWSEAERVDPDTGEVTSEAERSPVIITRHATRFWEAAKKHGLTEDEALRVLDEETERQDPSQLTADEIKCTEEALWAYADKKETR